MSTHGPIDPQYHRRMNRLARKLAKLFAPYGFALLVFPFGEGRKNRINYISNARRAEMIVAMKEFIARSEGMDVDTPETLQ